MLVSCCNHLQSMVDLVPRCPRTRIMRGADLVGPLDQDLNLPVGMHIFIIQGLSNRLKYQVHSRRTGSISLHGQSSCHGMSLHVHVQVHGCGRPSKRCVWRPCRPRRALKPLAHQEHCTYVYLNRLVASICHAWHQKNVLSNPIVCERLCHKLHTFHSRKHRYAGEFYFMC
jgi:hypothetical protein